MNTNIDFSQKQKMLLEIGQKRNAVLKTIVQNALSPKTESKTWKRHYYIAGGAGVGKTSIVEATAKELEIDLIHIESVSSVNALVIKLAVASYLSRDKHMHVFIDDCDSLFKSTESLSVMKGILDESRNILSWNKNMSIAIATFEKRGTEADTIKAKALKHFQPDGSVGIEISTKNMTFICTSNHQLAASNPQPTTPRKIDEASVRDRINYIGYPTSLSETWGWMAATTLESDLFNLTDEQKFTLLNWMYFNLKELPSLSLRAIKDMECDIINYPETYKMHWEMRLKSF